MSFLSKLGVVASRAGIDHPVNVGNGRLRAPLHVSTAVHNPQHSPHVGRFSNGLKEFLWQLEGMRRGTLLDMGPPWQDTLNFFIERGFKVYTEDLLNSWAGFLRDEKQQTKDAAMGGVEAGRCEEAGDPCPDARAERFITANLQHTRDTFDAVLLWDLLDYLERDTAALVISRLAGLVRNGGVILAVFHMRTPCLLY